MFISWQAKKRNFQRLGGRRAPNAPPSGQPWKHLMTGYLPMHLSHFDFSNEN